MNSASYKRLLATIFSDGVILQRDEPIRVWGWAVSGALVKIKFSKSSNFSSFGGENPTVSDTLYEAKAADDGAWEIYLPPLPASGSYELMVSSGKEISKIHDILIGDVWICSGQSNMQLSMQRVKNVYPQELHEAKNPYIRQFSVPIKFDFHAQQDDFSESEWISVTPEHTHQFSAVGYFFAKSLYERYGVPIGLILSAVGGTPIQAWMSREALKDFPEDIALADQCRNNQDVQDVQQEDQCLSDKWYRALDDEDPGFRQSWFSPGFDDTEWEETVLCKPWSETPALSSCGSVWFRQEVFVPEPLAGKPVRLFLGCIVDADYTYVNGDFVGSVGYRYPPREYALPCLKAGYNLIAIRVISNSGIGGFVPDKPYKLVWEDAELVLDTQWKFRRGVTCEPLAPTTFFQYRPTGLYNSMIAPLHRCAIKGVIWYQGESDTESPAGYYERFRSMVEDWRIQWGQGDFPFLFVQLANFIPPEPQAYSLAVLREEQRKALTIPNTGMAVAIDVGEYNDLHPTNKKDIGDRLALAAFRIVYREEVVHSGPVLDRAEFHGSEAQCVSGGSAIPYKVVLRFTSIGSGLKAKGGESLQGFAAGIEGSFVPVKAVIKGDTVVVSGSEIGNATAIRYAWSDNPCEANLYNMEDLPASPFMVEFRNRTSF